MSSVEAFRRSSDYACWCGKYEASQFCRQMFGKRPFVVLQCLACQTHRILPRSLATQEAAATLYNEYHADFSELELERFAETILHRCGQVGVRFSETKSVLDVGCGNGYALNAICDKFGCEGLGIDVDRRRIASAREKARRAVFECGLFDATNCQRTYDIVLLNAVLEHVVNPVSFLRQLREAMAPESSLFLLTPNAASLNYWFLRSWWRELLSIGEHIYLFTPESLAACASRAGLQVAALSSGFDFVVPQIKLSPPRQALVSAWSIYREAIKRLSSAFSSNQSGDILYARLERR